MPTYEYKCIECGMEIEIDHGIKEDAREHHRHSSLKGRGDCNGKLKRLIPRSTSFTWKGGPPTPKNFI